MLKPALSFDEKMKVHLQGIEDHVQDQFKAAQKTVLSKTAELSERLKAARFIWLVTRKSEDKRRMIELIMQHELQ